MKERRKKLKKENKKGRKNKKRNEKERKEERKEKEKEKEVSGDAFSFICCCCCCRHKSVSCLMHCSCSTRSKKGEIAPLGSSEKEITDLPLRDNPSTELGHTRLCKPLVL